MAIDLLVYKYLEFYSYNIDRRKFELQMQTNPDYPSFKAISDTFDYFGVNHKVLRLNRQQFQELPKKFITIYASEIVLVYLRGNNVIMSRENLEIEKIPFDIFSDSWDGIVILIEESKPINFLSRVYINKSKIFMFLLLSIFIYICVYYNGIYSLAYSFCSLFGMVVSYYIFKESIGSQHSSISNLCYAISKKGGCSEIIRDENFKIFSIISFSDASIIYFLSLASSLVLLGYYEPLFFMLAICSLPLVIFSLFYQSLIKKTWCFLCVLIDAILIVQFLILLNNFDGFEIKIDWMIKFIFLGLILLGAWLLFKELAIEKIRLENLEFDYFKFQRKFTYFENELKNNKLQHIDYYSSLKNRISFGDRHSAIKIIAVSNPTCKSCIESFKVYSSLLKNRDDVEITFVFSVPFLDLDHPSTKIAIRVIYIYLNESKEQAWEAISDWYLGGNYEIWNSKWCKKYESNALKDQKIIDVLIEQNRFLVLNHIDFAPETLVNGYLFPKSYNIHDLMIFIDDLISRLI